MAQGDHLMFHAYSERVGLGKHTYGTNVVKAAVITNALTPVVTEPNPRWTATYSGAEVNGTGYTPGGIALSATAAAWVRSANVSTLQSDATTYAQNAAGFTNGRWVIVYDDTDPDKVAISFLDLGGIVSVQAAPLIVNWGSVTPNGAVLTHTAPP